MGASIYVYTLQSNSPSNSNTSRTALPRQVQLGADAHGDEDDAGGDPRAVRELHLLGLGVVRRDAHARADLHVGWVGQGFGEAVKAGHYIWT